MFNYTVRKIGVALVLGAIGVSWPHVTCSSEKNSNANSGTTFDQWLGKPSAVSEGEDTSAFSKFKCIGCKTSFKYSDEWSFNLENTGTSKVYVGFGIMTQMKGSWKLITTDVSRFRNSDVGGVERSFSGGEAAKIVWDKNIDVSHDMLRNNAVNAGQLSRAGIAAYDIRRGGKFSLIVCEGGCGTLEIPYKTLHNFRVEPKSKNEKSDLQHLVVLNCEATGVTLSTTPLNFEVTNKGARSVAFNIGVKAYVDEKWTIVLRRINAVEKQNFPLILSPSQSLRFEIGDKPLVNAMKRTKENKKVSSHKTQEYACFKLFAWKINTHEYGESSELCELRIKINGDMKQKQEGKNGTQVIY